MRIFVDASAFIALLVETDSNHARAAEIAARLASEDAELVTSNMVIAEVLTVVSMRFRKALAIQFGTRMMQGGVRIVHPSAFLFERAWHVWKDELRKDVSFVDVMSFAIIEDMAIPEAFSFDQHFLKRRFEVLS